MTISINVNQLAQQELTPNKMLRLKEDKLEIVEKTSWRRFKAFMGSNSYNLQKIMTKISDNEINVDGRLILNRNFYRNILEINFISEKFNDKNKQKNLFFQSVNINFLMTRIITDIKSASLSSIEDELKLKTSSANIIRSIFVDKFTFGKQELLESVESKFSNLLEMGHKQKQAFIASRQKEYRPNQWEVYRATFFSTIESRLKSTEGKPILNVSVSSFAKEKTVSQVEGEAVQIFKNLGQKAGIDSQQYTVQELVTHLAQDSILLNEQGQLAFNYVHLVAILADVNSQLMIPTKEGSQPLKTILVQLIEHFADHGTSTSSKATEKLFTKLNAIYFDLKNHQYS